MLSGDWNVYGRCCVSVAEDVGGISLANEKAAHKTVRTVFVGRAGHNATHTFVRHHAVRLAKTCSKHCELRHGEIGYDAVEGDDTWRWRRGSQTVAVRCLKCTLFRRGQQFPLGNTLVNLVCAE
jgi:hypothetical protein